MIILNILLFFIGVYLFGIVVVMIVWALLRVEYKFDFNAYLYMCYDWGLKWPWWVYKLAYNKIKHGDDYEKWR